MYSRPNRYQNKLVLFYPDSLIGWLITLVTRSPFSHAAVMFNGVLYDASESRGTFDRSTIDLETRKHIALDLECPDAAFDLWLRSLTGKQYDYKGILGWVMGIESTRKVYCFEAAWLALFYAGIATGNQPGRLSGSDLLVLMLTASKRPGVSIEVDLAASILELIGGRLSKQYIYQLKQPEQLYIARDVLAAAVSAIDAESPADALHKMCSYRKHVLAVEESIHRQKISIRA